MNKSPDAFRTISEVADWLETPTHVLRFWESRFTQVKPVKRAGGRRYYRPTDMELLGGIKKLLHEDGMTIRGVQKLLREEGIKHVAALSPPINGQVAEAEDDTVYDTTALPDESASGKSAPMIADAPQEDVDNVVPLSRTLAETEAGRKPHAPAEVPDVAASDSDQRDLLGDLPDGTSETAKEASKPAAKPAATPETPPATGPAATADTPPTFATSRTEPEPKPEPAPEAKSEPEPEREPQETAAKPPAPRPATVDVPADPEDNDRSFAATPGFLSTLRHAANRPPPAELQPLYDRLAKLRDRMQSDKRS